MKKLKRFIRRWPSTTIVLAPCLSIGVLMLFASEMFVVAMGIVWILGLVLFIIELGKESGEL